MNSLKVFTNLTEYSRYEPGRDVIGVRLISSGASDGETIEVSLVRGVFGAIATKDIECQTGVDNYSIEFALNELHDDDGIYQAPADRYTVQAKCGVTAVSQAFDISLVTVESMKREWCFGIPLLAGGVLEPVQQPQSITGVEITDVSAGTLKGAYKLSWDPATRRLMWGGGTPVVIGDQPIGHMLVDRTGREFIVAKATPWELPTKSQDESIIIEQAKMSNDTLRRHIRDAVNWVEAQVFVPLEPRIYATEYCRDGVYERHATPAWYYKPADRSKWLQIELARPQLRKVIELKGYINQSHVLDVDHTWQVTHERDGIIYLVPSSMAAANLLFYQWVGLGYPILFNYQTLPNFWHFRIIQGFNDLYDERSTAREAVAKKAAIDILTAAGMAFRGGVGSESISRDGVSQSVSYTTSGQYGLYAATIEEHRKWLDLFTKREVRRLRGFVHVTL